MPFRIHLNIVHLRHIYPKHKEFLDTTQLILNVTIDYHNFAQAPHIQFVESTQEKVLESTGDYSMFKFLGKVDSLSNVRNFKTFASFIKKIKKLWENQG